MVRHLMYNNSVDTDEYNKVILSISESRQKIYRHSPRKKVLLYCIDTLSDIINEGDREKIIDFADAIHNIPEIYMKKRNLYSFREEFKAFQKKYGKQYFPFIDEIKPYFSNKGFRKK